MEMLLPILRKMLLSLPFIATENWSVQNTNLKSVFFWQTNFFGKIDFFWHNFSEYVNCGKISICLREGFWEIWLAQG